MPLRGRTVEDAGPYMAFRKLFDKSQFFVLKSENSRHWILVTAVICW